MRDLISDVVNYSARNIDM